MNYLETNFLKGQVKESNLTKAKVNSSTFKNGEFLNSNLEKLELILALDIRVWSSKKYIDIKESINFANILKDMSLIIFIDEDAIKNL